MSEITVFGWTFRDMSAALFYYGIDPVDRSRIVEQYLNKGPGGVEVALLSCLTMEELGENLRLHEDTEAGFSPRSLPLNAEQLPLTDVGRAALRERAGEAVTP